jgi:hypothetical protein
MQQPEVQDGDTCGSASRGQAPSTAVRNSSFVGDAQLATGRPPQEPGKRFQEGRLSRLEAAESSGRASGALRNFRMTRSDWLTSLHPQPIDPIRLNLLAGSLGATFDPALKYTK